MSNNPMSKYAIKPASIREQEQQLKAATDQYKAAYEKLVAGHDAEVRRQVEQAWDFAIRIYQADPDRKITVTHFDNMSDEILALIAAKVDQIIKRWNVES